MVPKTGAMPCKLGTQPYMLIVDKRCRIIVGNKIRVRNPGTGHRWFKVTVDKVNDDGYFFATR